MENILDFLTTPIIENMFSGGWFEQFSIAFMKILLMLNVTWLILTIPLSIYGGIVHDDWWDYILSLNKNNDAAPTGAILIMVGLILIIANFVAPISMILIIFLGTIFGISYLSKYLKNREPKRKSIEKLIKEKSKLELKIEEYKNQLITN